MLNTTQTQSPEIVFPTILEEHYLEALVEVLLIDKTEQWETRSIYYLEQQTRKWVNHW